jgi:hypothetical protein
LPYQEVKRENYGQRIVSSIIGVIVGLIMFAAATYVLYWNEGRTVRRGDAIQEARQAAVEMPGVAAADPSFDGKLVHATGFADTKDVLRDAAFGVEATAISLRRDVEYYQWVERSKSETKDKLGGGTETVTTYSYEAKWTDAPQNSANFKDPNSHSRNRNFILAQIDDAREYAPNVTFGAYKLPAFIRDSIGGAVPAEFELPQDVKEAYSARVKTALEGEGKPAGGGAEVVHTGGGTVYFGLNPSSPSVGDVRVSFKVVRPADISILAVARGETFEKFTASNKNDFYEVAMGTVSAEEMFKGAEAANAIIAWVLRAVGALFVIIGIRLFIGPIAILASVIPFLGNIVGAGSTLVAFLFGIAWSLILIAFAWLRFRPLLGGGLLAAAALLFAMLYFRGRSRRAAVN